jgi:cytochrome c553
MGNRLGAYLSIAAATLLAVSAAPTQDAARGERLFNDTAAVTGAAVAPCVACHGSTAALREMIRNRGGQVDEAKQLARWIDAVIEGAQPGAKNAKLQYRGVLTRRDVLDLAAYIARTAKAEAPAAVPPPALDRTSGAAR